VRAGASDFGGLVGAFHDASVPRRARCVSMCARWARSPADGWRPRGAARIRMPDGPMPIRSTPRATRDYIKIAGRRQPERLRASPRTLLGTHVFTCG
jgi:hypothetical protein